MIGLHPHHVVYFKQQLKRLRKGSKKGSNPNPEISNPETNGRDFSNSTNDNNTNENNTNDNNTNDNDNNNTNNNDNTNNNNNFNNNNTNTNLNENMHSSKKNFGSFSILPFLENKYSENEHDGLSQQRKKQKRNANNTNKEQEVSNVSVEIRPAKEVKVGMKVLVKWSDRNLYKGVVVGEEVEGEKKVYLVSFEDKTIEKIGIQSIFVEEKIKLEKKIQTQWTCDVCTYENTAKSKVCEMCRKIREM